MTVVNCIVDYKYSLKRNWIIVGLCQTRTIWLCENGNNGLKLNGKRLNSHLVECPGRNCLISSTEFTLGVAIFAIDRSAGYSSS